VRKIILFILCILIISLAAPLHAVASAAPPGDSTVILTLDIYGSSGSTLSAESDDMPSIYECSWKMIPLAFAGFHRTSRPAYASIFIPFQEERPPKI